MASATYAGPKSFLELTGPNKTHQGKLVARNRQMCWLIDRDGSLNSIKLDTVQKYRRLSSTFHGYSAMEMRSHLRREFGKQFEVTCGKHYVVCAAPGKSKQYLKIFEDVYRTFYHYFSVRNYKLSKPDFPLVAVIFPSRTEFADYCAKDKINAAAGMVGYYLRTSNRVAMFDSPREMLTSSKTPSSKTARPTSNRPRTRYRYDRNVESVEEILHADSIEGSLRDTIVHEATHQIAFNSGLHSRIGETPKWVIEGLATVLEAPGIRDSSTSRFSKTRLNRGRFVRFGNFAADRRKKNSLSQFVSTDTAFRSNILDAYSEAWALSFWLIETRPRQYEVYLKSIIARDPLAPYSAEQRLDDFKKAFGTDLKQREAEFLRYIQKWN